MLIQEIINQQRNQRLFKLCRCNECPLKDQPGPVFGSGRTKPQFMMIAEAPGRNEAERGVPMVGDSGKMNDAILDYVGSHRKDIYITNTTLCRPKPEAGKDVPPPPEAIAACEPRLLAEIAEIDPTIVVTTGATSTNTLLQFNPPAKISSMIGSMNWSERIGKFVVPTWHPAYLLHSMSSNAFDNIAQTYRKAMRLATGEYRLPDPHEKLNWHLAATTGTIRSALKYVFDHPGRWAIDTETEWAGDQDYQLLTIQFSNDGYTVVVQAPPLLADPELVNLTRKLLLSRAHEWVFHNAQFDMKYLWHWFGVEPTNVEDTMALALCLTEFGDRVGLKALSREWLNSNFYEKDVDLSKVGPRNPTSKVAPPDKLHPYAAYDTIYTHRLKPVLEQQVAEEGNRHLYERILLPAQKAFARMEYDGILVDKSVIKEIQAEWRPKAAEAKRKIQEFAKKEGFDPGMAVKVPKDDLLNIGSWKQMHHLMFDMLGFQPVRRGKRSVDKDFLKKYQNHEIIKLIQSYRRIAKMLSTYVDGIEKWIDRRGYIHPDFLLFGTMTGRISIKDPPMQTIPADATLNDKDIDEHFSSLKKMFPAPPGYVFCEADYNALELYIGYHWSGDPRIKEGLDTGLFHEIAASNAFEVPLEKIIADEAAGGSLERLKGKRVSYGTMYGITPAGLVFQIPGSTEAECSMWINNWLNGFPQFRDWCEEQRETVMETGRLTTPTGRVRRWSWIPAEHYDHVMNQAINFPNQSLANDLCLLSLIELNQSLRARDLGYPILTVHDSIEFYLREDKLDESVPLIRETMMRPKFETPVEAFPVEIKIGPNWGATTKVE